MCSVSKHLLCAITEELMVDPVLAEDGRTYERTELKKWLVINSTSPLDPSCSIDASQLVNTPNLIGVLIYDKKDHTLHVVKDGKHKAGKISGKFRLRRRGSLYKRSWKQYHRHGNERSEWGVRYDLGLWNRPACVL